MAFIISYPLAKILNKIKYFHEDFSFDYTINKWGDESEKLIWNTLGEKNDLDKLLMVTTNNNKVYIGQINQLTEPINNTHIQIIPSFSGYRDKETQQVKLNTDYTDTIEYYTRKKQSNLIDNKLGVIIPFENITFISRFDHDIYRKFNNTKVLL